jgi:tetratricopeptide (TPR) repeat protein
MNYAIALTHIENYTGAEINFDKAIYLDAKLWAAYANRSNVYIHFKKYNEAILDLNRAISHFSSGSDKAGIYSNRANVYGLLEKHDKEIEDLSKAIHLYKDGPEKAKCYYRRALCHTIKGNNKVAVQDINNSIRIDPNFGAAYIIRASHLAKIHKVKEALDDLAHTIEIESDAKIKAEAYRLRGIYQSEEGLYNLAVVDFDNAILLDPGNCAIYFNKGLCNLHHCKYKESILNFDKAIRLNTEYPEAYTDRGVAYSYLDEYEKAVEDLNLAIIHFRNKDESAIPYRHLAVNLIRLGRNAEADEAFVIAEKIAPNDISTYGTKIQIEYFKGNFTLALELIERGEKIFENPGEFGLWKGIVLFHLDRPSEALLSIRSTLILDIPMIILDLTKSHLEGLKLEHHSSPELDIAIELVNTDLENKEKKE